MQRLPNDAALLVIDVQEGIDDPRHGTRSNPGAEANIARMLSAWRASGRPIIHVQHLSTEPDSALRPERPGVAIKQAAMPLPGEPLLRKHRNSAFIGTDLEARLRQDGITTLVIAGLTADHCVSATTRMAGDLGFTVYLAGDATAAFGKVAPDGTVYSAETVHAVSLATLEGEFARVVSTDDLLRAAGPIANDAGNSPEGGGPPPPPSGSACRAEPA